MELEQLNEFIHELLYEKLDDDDYVSIMESLGAKRRGNRYTSICHHSHNEECGYNLSYSKDTRSYYCFSQCKCLYNLLDLVKKVRSNNNEDARTIPSVKWICEQAGVECDFNVAPSKDKYKWNYLNKYAHEEKELEPLTIYDDTSLQLFDDVYHMDWINEGISIETMQKYEIKWYEYRQQIVIPNRNENGDLVGIRIRNMLPDAEAKYMPLYLLNGSNFKFPSGRVFYGEYQNVEAIKRKKKVFIVEAEKSVLKSDTWFGDENYTLALYGSVLTKEKLDKLLEWGVTTFIIGLDSDFNEYGDDDYTKFEENVFDMAKMIKPYSDEIYVVYNNQGYKDAYKYSPFDFTREQFDVLWENKEKIIDIE